MTATPKYMGRPMKRVEDPRLIKGIGTYVDDMTLPGLLHGAFGLQPCQAVAEAGVPCYIRKVLSGLGHPI